MPPVGLSAMDQKRYHEWTTWTPHASTYRRGAPQRECRPLRSRLHSRRQSHPPRRSETILPYLQKQTLTGTAKFEVHLENKHILAEAEKALTSTIRLHHHPRAWSFQYNHWRMEGYKHWRDTLTSLHTGSAPHADALLDVMKPTEELYRHRLEILRLWPLFACHPVFDDVRLVEYDTQPENTPSTSTVSTDTAGTETADAPRKVNGRNRKKRNSNSSGPARKGGNTTSGKRAKSSGHQHD